MSDWASDWVFSKENGVPTWELKLGEAWVKLTWEETKHKDPLFAGWSWWITTGPDGYITQSPYASALSAQRDVIRDLCDVLETWVRRKREDGWSACTDDCGNLVEMSLPIDAERGVVLKVERERALSTYLGTQYFFYQWVAHVEGLGYRKPLFSSNPSHARDTAISYFMDCVREHLDELADLAIKLRKEKQREDVA